MKEIIETSNAPAPIGPYSQAVKVGNMYFLSGQIAIDPATGNMITDNLEAETHQVMKNIGAILTDQGLDYSHIVKTSIFLQSMGDFGEVNGIYGSYFSSDFPARETVEVAGLPKGVNVEISVIAVKG
ncbi:MAG: RidA family protein [Bacteroidia bacterium]|nr:RidA family protein [Bacteroidia bacterium]